MTHKLIIDYRRVETACGLEAAVFYPQVEEIMTKKGITARVTFDDTLVTCDRCNALSFVALDKALAVIAPIMANAK